MAKRTASWKYLRTKTDETADDTDWAGTNAEPDDAISGHFAPETASDGRPLTGIEVIVQGVDGSRAPQARATMTVDITLIEVIPRTDDSLGGATGLAPLIVDSALEEDVLLQTKVYFPLNGTTKFTIRITGDVNDAVDNLEIWWREVTR